MARSVPTPPGDGGAPADASEPPAPPDPARAPDALFDAGYRYDFFQAVRLLERSADGPAIGTTADAGAERVRIRPSEALAFPGADVRRVAPRPGGGGDVVATFGGLYGVDAAIPVAFHQSVGTDDSGLRDFLDLFARRLYALLYRAWASARPELDDAPSRPWARRFRALAGAAQEARWDAPAAPLSLAAFAGRLSDRRRNADGLRAIAESWTGAPVRVVENVPRWITLADRPTLGGAAPRLGRGTPVGGRVLDLAGKIRLQIGPLSLSDFGDLLPGEPRARALASAVRFYVRDALAVEVELLLDAADVRPTVLGGGTVGQLGRTAFVGHPQGETVRRVATYDL